MLQEMWIQYRIAVIGMRGKEPDYLMLHPEKRPELIAELGSIIIGFDYNTGKLKFCGIPVIWTEEINESDIKFTYLPFEK